MWIIIRTGIHRDVLIKFEFLSEFEAKCKFRNIRIRGICAMRRICSKYICVSIMSIVLLTRSVSWYGPERKIYSFARGHSSISVPCYGWQCWICSVPCATVQVASALWATMQDLVLCYWTECRIYLCYKGLRTGSVLHNGLQGRICSVLWATVQCLSFAMAHSAGYVPCSGQ
jgi:hypothetical protein